MRRIIAAAAVAVALAACSAPATVPVTVHVANQAGIPLPGTAVTVNHMLSPQQTVPVGTYTTDDTGTVALDLPTNITAQVGLGPDPTWQMPFVAGEGGYELWYMLPQDIPCHIVDPAAPPCPVP